MFSASLASVLTGQTRSPFRVGILMPSFKQVVQRHCCSRVRCKFSALSCWTDRVCEELPPCDAKHILRFCEGAWVENFAGSRLCFFWLWDQLIHLWTDSFTLALETEEPDLPDQSSKIPGMFSKHLKAGNFHSYFFPRLTLQQNGWINFSETQFSIFELYFSFFLKFLIKEINRLENYKAACSGNTRVTSWLSKHHHCPGSVSLYSNICTKETVYLKPFFSPSSELSSAALSWAAPWLKQEKYCSAFQSVGGTMRRLIVLHNMGHLQPSEHCCWGSKKDFSFSFQNSLLLLALKYQR